MTDSSEWRPRGTGTIPAAGIVMRSTVFSLGPAMLLAAVSSIVGASYSSAQQPPETSVSATLFTDIARRQNPVVVSVMTRSRVRTWREGDQELVPSDLGPRVRRTLGSGFIISGTGEILTNHHVVEGAERIEVSLFGDDRKRYRAIRVGSDP